MRLRRRATPEGPRLLTCALCGQTYNPAYMRYCARCGEALPDVRGRKPKPGPADGMGARGGISTRRLMGAPAPPRSADSAGSGAQEWQAPQSVLDMVLEYRNQLNAHPEDHATRYALGLAYYYAREWSRAAEEFRLVTEAEPDYADAFEKLAQCRARLERQGR
jgi:hypothetical protein